MAKQSRLPSFLLTRPAAQAGRFAVLLRERFGDDIQIVCAPLLAPRFLIPEIPQRPFHALIFTSETGVQGFQRLTADPALAAVRVAWCVGDRTAQAATEAGLVAHSAKGDVLALQRALLAQRHEGPLLYLHGQNQQGDLAQALLSAGLETVCAVVYAQKPCRLTPAAVDLLSSDKTVILPLFSPRTASIFVSEWQETELKARLLVVAMSDAVAQAAGSLPFWKMVVAQRPDAAAMVKAIAGLIATAPDA